MKRRWLVVAAVGVLALGAAAQVTREEFDKLAGEVRMLRAEVVLLRLKVRALTEQAAPDPDLFEEDVEWKKLKLAPFAIEPEPQSGALDVEDGGTDIGGRTPDVSPPQTSDR